MNQHTLLAQEWQTLQHNHEQHEKNALLIKLFSLALCLAGLAQAALRKLVARAFERASLADHLPDVLRKNLKLAGWERSLRYLHQPPPDAKLGALEDRSHPAWRRIKFDEVRARADQALPEVLSLVETAMKEGSK